MLRRILLAVILAGAAGFEIFWWLTAPMVVAANSLSPHTPNLANGLTTFNAGGCSSCHAVPNQPDRLKLGGGLAIPSPFGTFHVPNISPDPNDGSHRSWTEKRRMRRMPSQKAGIDITATKVAWMERSISVPRLTAAKVASGSVMITASAVA